MFTQKKYFESRMPLILLT